MGPSRNRYAIAVDNDVSFLITLKLMLRLCGFRYVVTAEDGAEAFDILNSWRFDVIVSDWNMEIMDGVELLRRVRQNPLTAQTPFILMTASLSETAWRSAIEYGATDFLVKPIGLKSLRATCQLCLQLQEFEGSTVISLTERLRKRRFNV